MPNLIERFFSIFFKRIDIEAVFSKLQQQLCQTNLRIQELKDDFKNLRNSQQSWKKEVVKHVVRLRREQDGQIAQLNSEVATQRNVTEKLAEQIVHLHQELTKLRDGNKEPVGKIAQLNNELATQRNVNAKLAEQIVQLRQELSGQIAQLNREVVTLRDENAKLARQVARLQLTTPPKPPKPTTPPAPKAASTPSPKPTTTPKSTPTTVSPSPPKPTTPPASQPVVTPAQKVSPEKAIISKFCLASVPPAPFKGEREKILNTLRRATDVDDILTFLRASNSPQAPAYVRSMEKHKNNIQKLCKKMDADAYDDYSLSEDLTHDFFKEFQSPLLDNVVIAIYRGLKGKEDLNFYKQFITKLNAYLHRCGLYTRSVVPGTVVSDKDYEDMEPLVADAKVRNDNNRIREVERLPYYINYVSDDGSEAPLYYSGSMVILKYKNGQGG